MNMVIVWLVAAVVFVAVEAATAAMCSVWCAVGALAALIAAALAAPVWLQVTLFILVSGLCFLLLYPKLRRFVGRNRQATNADMVIGKTCLVTQTIDELAGTGTVSVGGKTWTARARAGERIPEGALVQVEDIQGVKLMVTAVQNTSAAV